MTKVVSILGTRPEIVKFSPILPLFDVTFEHVLIHTGQHYDQNMDGVFFSELMLNAPDHFLSVGAAELSAGAQTARMLEGVEAILVRERPDWVAVLGDTNSTLAGALAAAKLHIAVAHLEAGCRSFNRNMPEEQNRVMVDHISEKLFAPDAVAEANLLREGIDASRIRNVGNTGLEAAKRTMALVDESRLVRFGVVSGEYVVATIHRAENTSETRVLRSLIAALNSISERISVLFPVHPRTKAVIEREEITLSERVIVLPPLGNLDFTALLRFAMFVLSDSGGVQEEAAVVNRPCLILRSETEWGRLVDAGKNILVGTESEPIVNEAYRLIGSTAERKRIAAISAPLRFGASRRIVDALEAS